MLSYITQALSLTLAFFVMRIVKVGGHGRLWEPPSRSSMWRRGYNAPVNYQDMELFCGGVGVQYGQNGGKCGVCGDPWNGPRENEAGGKYASGIIVRKYETGQVIDVIIDLTANHKGYFEFHLCPMDNPFKKVTEECLSQYPLAEVSSGLIKYPVPNTQYNAKIDIKLRLPSEVKCRACMLRWKYVAGNSWGTNPDGTSCIGCGDQEQFYGCADVAIGYDDVILEKEPIRHPWFFEEEETEWHSGIVKYPVNQTDNSSVGLFRQTNVFTILFMNVINIILVSLVLLSTS